MAETWTEEQVLADGFERVYAELEWYDGPRVGLADINGKPHYFQNRDYAEGTDEYQVWPASEAAVTLEREQWAIFTRWNERRAAGEFGPESHPDHGGIDARYDELELLLAPHRQEPDDARRLVGEVRFVAGPRYRAEGPDYWFRWRPSRAGRR
ncbi:hypothetical protein SAM40697_3164 [Streptomyces ambofaciens]|uniref:Uncharacterized protein n=1 Tax=Streptomyces ambofaciens TaxID=1889 RepID=A0ABN4P7C4_STRAM|nr:hypothetical protein [Streptomyces ambofaciens]ANB07122.1 hypothetical protein SAM40697_3164 [Streptomyces ambofaciens]